MKLLSFLLLCLPLCILGEKLENEKNIKLKGSKDQGSLSMKVMIEYNHKDGKNNKKKYPTSFLSHVFNLDGSQLIATFKLDETKMTFENLRNHLTKVVSGKTLVNAMITDENFNESMNKYPGYVLEDDIDEQIMKNSARHFYNHNKLVSAILPFHFFIGLFALILFANRSKFDDHHHLQFSPPSKLIFSFLIFRLFYDLLYLSYLMAFQFLGKFHDNSFLHYFFLVSDQILGLAIFHGCVTMFVQGFLTLSKDKNLWYGKDSLVMSFLYFLSFTCVRVYLRIKHSDNNNDSLTKYVFTMNDQTLELGYFMMFFTFAMRLLILYLMIKSFQRTYLKSNKNSKFLSSFIVILVAYFLSGYIKFPIFFKISSLTEVLKNELIGEGDIDFVTEAISVPEIIQIITSCRLIYIWRAVDLKKKDEEYK